MKTVYHQLHGYFVRCTMYNVSIDNLVNNYMVNIIDYILCFTTTHFLWNQEEEEEERKLYFSNLLHIHQHTFLKYMIHDTVGY